MKRRNGLAWNITFVFVVALVLAGFWHLAFAAGEKKVAVLELVNKAGVTDDEAYSLTDQVRIVASQTLPGGHFIVMTSENIQELLPPDMDLKKCTDAKCEVEMGRMLGADYIVTGEIIRFGGRLQINLRTHNSFTSHFVFGGDVESDDVLEMKTALRGLAGQLMAKVLSHSGIAAPAQTGGGAVFVSPTQPSAPAGAAEVRALAPTEQPPATATGPAGLYITSNPPGADVYLGNTKAGTTSPAFQKVNLQAGTKVRVTLKMSLFHDVAFDVDLKPGVMKFENVALKPAFGSLTIESEPTGAKVLIGGSEVGTTPYNNPRYPSGDYLVSVEKEWYLPQSDQMISVKDGETTKKMFTLSQDFGTLDVQSNPVGAEVTLDGKKLGTTPGSWRVPPVQSGTVEVALAQHRGKSFSITIDRNQTVKITAEQATLTAKVGSLQVYADPPEPGAKVFVDGREVGTAPATVSDLIEGSHEVKVETQEKAGTTTINIAEGQTAVATVTLESRGASGMVRIPAGTFTMGSPSGESGRDSDETQHTVTISRSFLLGTTEVTQGQWKAVMGSNPSKFTSCGDDCPVEKVSWNDVVDFCNRLSEKEGLSSCYSGSGNSVSWNQGCTGYRLPTEAEWEYAARAGTATRFACGDSDSCLGGMGWYSSNSNSNTHPVAQKQANAWGLYDMHGNVWEWVWDWKADYSSGSVTDPEGPSGGSYRVLRGGSWYYSAQYCRSADRGCNSPGDRYNSLGFRLARSLP